MGDPAEDGIGDRVAERADGIHGVPVAGARCDTANGERGIQVQPALVLGAEDHDVQTLSGIGRRQQMVTAASAVSVRGRAVGIVSGFAEETYGSQMGSQPAQTSSVGTSVSLNAFTADLPCSGVCLPVEVAWPVAVGCAVLQ